MQITDLNGKRRECVRVFLDPAWPGYASVEFARRADPSQTRIEWMPLADFALRNPQLKDLFGRGVASPPPEITGVVSSATRDTITDKIQNWQKNIYAGYNLWISRGMGEGQTCIILSNTKNKLVVDKQWGIKPDKTSQYTIVRHLGSTDQRGNTLPQAEYDKLAKLGRQLAKKVTQKIL